MLLQAARKGATPLYHRVQTWPTAVVRVQLLTAEPCLASGNLIFKATCSPTLGIFLSALCRQLVQVIFPLGEVNSSLCWHQGVNYASSSSETWESLCEPNLYNVNIS